MNEILPISILSNEFRWSKAMPELQFMSSTKDNVVDVIKANSHMDTGRKVILKFTAKLDDGDDDARRVETFIACIHYPFNKLRVLSCPLHSYRGNYFFSFLT
ncbi:hypothetical protein ACP275_04G227300 [Erythranthe tilingii]